MSFVFAGYPIETKPPKPRQDIRPGTDGNDPVDFVYQYKLYTDISFMGQFNIAIVIGDNVDRTKEQSIHSTIGYLLDFLMENRARLARDPIERQGIILHLPVNSVKSQTEITLTIAGATAQEIDLDQDAISLVFYVLSETAPSVLEYGAGPFRSAVIRLRELAREMNYWTVGEPRRDDPAIADQAGIVGGSATFLPPTWLPPTPNKLEWLENGVRMIPVRAGIQPLVLTDLTLDMDGNVYSVRAGYQKTPDQAPDAWRSSNIGTLTVTA